MIGPRSPMTHGASEGRTIGVRGQRWRALVDGHGTIRPDDGSPALGWHVAGDERWYSPAHEVTLRQKWYAGYPVCETRMRVGAGDVVQRIWCTADVGGITVVEFENETSFPVAVALTRDDLLITHDIQGVEPRGIDLPPGSVVYPLGHKATMRVGLAHVSPARGRLPGDVADHQAVVRGWESACNVASRLGLPDHTVTATVARVRSQILLDDTLDGRDGTRVIEAVRLGQRDRDSILGVVDAVQRRVRAERRSTVLEWDTPHLLAAAARACVLLEDEVAAGDIGATWLKMADREVAEPPMTMPMGDAAVAWAETICAQGSPAGGTCTVFPWGIPRPWWGAPVEAHGLIADPYRSVSVAVRWHGERPALLWEIGGEPGLVLDAGRTDPAWHTVNRSGEALLAAPVPRDD